MNINGFLKEQVLARLRFDNPWWINGNIDDYYATMRHRLFLDLFYQMMTDTALRRAVILLGPRRVGKTVMLYHSIQRLIDDGVEPNRIIYISIDTPIYNRIPLETLFHLACEAVGQPEARENFFVFYDEIQYLKDWEIHLKSLADSYLHVKFVASGSAAAALKMKSQESGAGRFSDFMLPPLTFNEYLHLKDLNRLIIPSKIIWDGQTVPIYDTIDIHRLNDHFLDYINYGGYPEVVFSKTIQANPQQFIKNDIVDKVLLKDLPSLYGITDVQDLNSFFTVIAYHSGNEFSYEKLSENSGTKKDMIRKYIEYLEAAFLIKVIHKTDINAKQFQRATQFKIYLTNPSLRSALFSTLRATDQEMGAMVETAVFAQWIQRENSGICYASWRQGRNVGEVDMVGVHPLSFKPRWAVEIKWSDRYFGKPRELISLVQFMPANKLKQAIVTSISKSGATDVDSLQLLFIPAAVYTYLVGKNTIDRKQQALGL